MATYTSLAAQYTEGDWKDRDSWMNVPRLFNWAGVEHGATVADIGCHEGYLSMHLAKWVGAEGKVFSVDVREDRLKTLKENAKKRKLYNVVPTLGDYDDPKLPANKMDVIFVVDTYHEIDEHVSMLSHIHKSLKPGGRILILEKLKDHARNKSRSDQANAHTLSPKYVKKELKDAGFTVTGEFIDIGNWENETSKKIWVLVAVVPDA
jgi:ubiquinone/menaquinone biosynthesis C-methylase UbiE